MTTDVIAVLRDRVDVALTEAARILAAGRAAAELSPARQALEDNRARWNSRMRVALAGRVSSGKSTLLNAILGQELAATGTHELTKVVTWLRHAQADTLTVTYKDAGREAQRVTPPTLAALTELVTHKAEPDADDPDDIDFVTYGMSSPSLMSFDLIDTPGLDSAQGIDSANTLRHLGPREDTADAIVLVFARGISTEDTGLLARFQRAAAAEGTEVSPLTTVGVLTKIELDWRPGQPLMAGDKLAVLAEGERTARGLMRNASVGRTLYEIRPVASKIAAAACTLTESDFTDLALLAAEGRLDNLGQLLGNSRKWQRAEIPGVPLSAGRRTALTEKFTPCGVMVACHLISDRGASGQAELADRLLEISGMNGLRQLLMRLFSERGDIVKAERLIKRTRAVEERYQATLSSNPRALDLLYTATGTITGLSRTETAFAERNVLRAYYDPDRGPELDEAETREMLRVFGEADGSRLVAERLGLPGAAPSVLIRHADERSAYWRDRAEQAANSDTRQACHVLSRSYDHLCALVVAHSRSDEGAEGAVIRRARS